MAGLSVGVIPQFYREVFDALCPGKNASKVSQQVWIKCMQTSSSLAQSVLEQIWLLCDPSESGSVSRDGLYKSLALCALAQQGKAVEEKALLHYGDLELPSPTLGDLAVLKDIAIKIYRAIRPTELGYSYEELKSLDEITVSILPEKKGMLFKHVEYLVESKVLKSSVRRRYSDFEVFYEVLVGKYPYRLVPKMPPKKFTPSSAFIEQRRRALKRFVMLIVRHPVLARDDVVKFFLTAGGQEVGARLKDKFKSSPDEFVFNVHGKNAEELVSEATRVKYERVCEQILLMQHIVSSMLSVAHNIESRSLAFGHDMKMLANNMSTLATDNLLMSSWTSGSDETWTYMQRDCNSLSGHFSSLSDQAHQQGVRETSGFTESVHLFLDLIISYQDLCERRERTVQRKHQKAMAKVQTMVNYKGRMESSGRQISEKDDSRIIKRDDDLISIEKRNFFSLFCLDLEAQLIHVNLKQFTEIFQHLVSTQVKGHTEFLSSWEAMKSLVDGMGVKVSSPTSSLNLSGGQRSPTKTSHREHTASPFI